MTMRFLRPAVMALGFAAAGCATQANVVDLQSEVASLKHRMGLAVASQPQPTEEGAMPGEAGGVPSASAEEVLDLVLIIDQIREELADVQGQVEQFFFRLDTLTQRTEQRLAAVEAKAGMEASISLTPFPAEPPMAAPTESAEQSFPGRSPGIRLPGVYIAPDEQQAALSQEAGAAFAMASRDLEKGHSNLAAAGFKNFIKQHPDSPRIPEATYLLGESFLSQGMDVEAINVWEMLAKMAPRHQVTSKALLSLGRTYRSVDNIPAAESALKRLVARFPDSQEAGEAKLILSELR